MDRVVNKTSLILLAALLCALLPVGLTQPADAAGNGVSFNNGSSHTLYVFARYGSGDRCEKKGKDQMVAIAAGQSASIDSGSDDICWCWSSREIKTCRDGWREAKAGTTQRLQ